MIELPPLDLALLVRLTREGGVAYLPGLTQPRSINLATCAPGVRQEVCEVLQRSAPLAVPECAQAGGDQRYFHIEIVMDRDEDTAISFDVPESQAPETLVQLWKAHANTAG
ncbi:MAG: protealysin inhibitor emfourin [Achromobacter piechaudii]